jgi:hypothetical protein
LGASSPGPSGGIIWKLETTILDHTSERSGALDCHQHFQNSTATRRLRTWETHMDLAFGPGILYIPPLHRNSGRRFTAFNGNIRRLTFSIVDRRRAGYLRDIVRNRIRYYTVLRCGPSCIWIRHDQGVDTQFMNTGRKFTFITIQGIIPWREWTDISRVASWWSNREVGGRRRMCIFVSCNRKGTTRRSMRRHSFGRYTDEHEENKTINRFFLMYIDCSTLHQQLTQLTFQTALSILLLQLTL